MSSRIRRRLATMRGWFPLRPAGAALLALASYVALWLSRAEADYLLHPASFIVLGLVVGCVILVAAGAASLARQVRALPAGVADRFETTHTVSTAFRVRGLGRWLLLEVRLEWREPSSVDATLVAADGWLEERVTPRLRGRHERLVRRFSVEDVFGIAGVTFEREWATPLYVVPAAAARVAELLPSHAFGDAAAHPSGREEGDLVEMRHYAHGDSLKHVLWKTFARTRRLLVRMPERAMAPRPLSVALFVAGPSDEPSAGTARVYLEQGLLGPDFLFAADGASKPTRSPAEALEQIVASSRFQAEGGATLEALVAQIEPSRLGALVVFAPPTDGPWRQRLTALVQSRGLRATVVIGVDTFAATAPESPGRLRRLLFEVAGPQALEGGVGALRGALEAAGLTVHLVHRPTGQSW